MLYLIDASSLITVYYTYYSPDMVPEFWLWLEFQARKGICKIPPMIFAEIKPKEPLAKLICRNEISANFQAFIPSILRVT